MNLISIMTLDTKTGGRSSFAPAASDKYATSALMAEFVTAK
jgi:hypothetical protein